MPKALAKRRNENHLNSQSGTEALEALSHLLKPQLCRPTSKLKSGESDTIGPWVTGNPEGQCRFTNRLAQLSPVDKELKNSRDWKGACAWFEIHSFFTAGYPQTKEEQSRKAEDCALDPDHKGGVWEGPFLEPPRHRHLLTLQETPSVLPARETLPWPLKLSQLIKSKPAAGEGKGHPSWGSGNS